MSADNYILIDRKTFKVYDGCASNNYKGLIGQGITLDDAIDIAQDYERHLEEEGSCVEYGIRFK